jgi:hypothetical protein
VRKTILALLFALSGSPSVSQAGELISRLLVDGTLGAAMVAGKKTRWEFEYVDSVTGHPPHHFHEMHGKPMHLIVVSEDLSTFAHLHPTNRPHSKKAFFIDVNSSSRDPDNFQLPTAVMKSGRYHLFGDVMPMGYGMLLIPYDVEVKGPKSPRLPLVADKLEADGAIVKYFDNEGRSANESAATYKAVLRIEAMDHCNTVLPKLYVDLFARSGNTFAPVQDLEPWLESYGHAIVMGAKGVSAKEKIAQHLHSVWPIPTGDLSKDERGPSVELAAHSHGQSTPTDRYRAWIQVKRASKILTLEFTIDWNLAYARRTAIPSGALNCLSDSGAAGVSADR